MVAPLSQYMLLQCTLSLLPNSFSCTALCFLHLTASAYLGLLLASGPPSPPHAPDLSFPGLPPPSNLTACPRIRVSSKLRRKFMVRQHECCGLRSGEHWPLAAGIALPWVTWGVPCHSHRLGASDCLCCCCWGELAGLRRSTPLGNQSDPPGRMNSP